MVKPVSLLRASVDELRLSPTRPLSLYGRGIISHTLRSHSSWMSADENTLN